MDLLLVLSYFSLLPVFIFFFFFFNDTATTEIYTLSLHDALPSSMSPTWANCRRPTGSPSRQAPSGRRGSGAVGSTWLVAARSLVAESPVWPVPAVPGRARRRVLCVRWVTVIGVLLGPRACTHPGTGRPGLHPGHPTAKEGCRPASRGLSLVLMTCSNHTRGLPGTRSAGPRHGLRPTAAEARSARGQAHLLGRTPWSRASRTAR